jgi:hypothetical protein
LKPQVLQQELQQLEQELPLLALQPQELQVEPELVPLALVLLEELMSSLNLQLLQALLQQEQSDQPVQ